MYNASTNATFMYSPVKADQAGAEAACNQQGGHLATYTSLAEQMEVEQVGKHAASQGALGACLLMGC
jgi:hypothetical protein